MLGMLQCGRTNSDPWARKLCGSAMVIELCPDGRWEGVKICSLENQAFPLEMYVQIGKWKSFHKYWSGRSE